MSILNEKDVVKAATPLVDSEVDKLVTALKEFGPSILDQYSVKITNTIEFVKK